MPITMGGMASGMDTDGIIEKLVKLEARPIRQMEDSKVKNRNRKRALKELENRLNKLNKSAKELYGFRASYDDKDAESSDPLYLGVKASKNSEKGIKKVKIIQIASSHKIATDPIVKSKKLPSGKFKLEIDGDEYKIRFKGGKLKSLQEKIDEVTEKAVATSYINTIGDKYILTIQSNRSGVKGEIKITGDKSFLKKIGLISGEKGEKKEIVDLTFDKKFFSGYSGAEKLKYNDGKLKVGKKGSSVELSGQLWQEYKLPLDLQIKKDTTLEVDFTYKKDKEEEKDKVPFRIELGPDLKIVIMGIELKGYNVSRIRKADPEKDKREFKNILGVGVISLENGKRKEKLYPIDKGSKGRQDIPVGGDFSGEKISSIVFYCNDGKTIFENVKITNPPEGGKGLLEPKNVIKKPENAILDIDGVKIIRDKNEGLNDVIKGLTLTLKKPKKDAITIKISSSTEKSIKKIAAFVEDFNNYIDFHKTLVAVDKGSKPGDYRRNQSKKKNGLFVGDMTIIRLQNSIKRVVNGAYPSITRKPIKLLSQIGVSSGEINAEWKSIKSGKLIVDEEKLAQIIIDNPDGVRNLFGSDTDGDNKTDNGLAYSVVQHLKPYISFGRNIISSKVSLENETLKLLDERIEKRRKHVSMFEDKLRRKFGAMERAISSSKSQGSWMKQQFGGGKKD